MSVFFSTLDQHDGINFWVIWLSHIEINDDFFIFDPVMNFFSL